MQNMLEKTLNTDLCRQELWGRCPNGKHKKLLSSVREFVTETAFLEFFMHRNGFALLNRLQGQFSGKLQRYKRLLEFASESGI